MTRSVAIGVCCLLILVLLVPPATAGASADDAACCCCEPPHGLAGPGCGAEILNACKAPDAPAHPPLAREAWYLLTALGALALVLWFFKEKRQADLKDATDRVNKDLDLRHKVTEHLLQLALPKDAEATLDGVTDALKEFRKRLNKLSETIDQKLDDVNERIEQVSTKISRSSQLP